jgi:hypothetical protein
MPQVKRRHTIYDVMEDKGVFLANPANVDSIDMQTRNSIYVKAEYPKLLYHPQGAERVIVAAQMEMTSFGPVKSGEQKELIWEQADNPADEKRLRTAGWHDHPAKAIAAAGKTPPPMASSTQVEILEDKMAVLQQQLAESQRQNAEMAAIQATGASAEAIEKAQEVVKGLGLQTRRAGL